MAVKYLSFFGIVMSVEPELNRLKSRLSRDVLWIYILSVLKKKPMHAYALRKEITEQFGFQPGNVTAYVVLYKLESRGFVSASKDGNRKTYKVTKKGLELFEKARVLLKETEKKLFS